MRTAFINGKPCVFLTPEPLAPVNPSDYTTAFVNIATEMVTETEPETDWQNDPEACRGYEEWLTSLETPEAFEEYDAWVTEQEREAFEAEMERQAEEWEQSQLGMVYAEELNAHPFRFTGGAA